MTGVEVMGAMGGGESLKGVHMPPHSELEDPELVVDGSRRRLGTGWSFGGGLNAMLRDLAFALHLAARFWASYNSCCNRSASSFAC